MARPQAASAADQQTIDLPESDATPIIVDTETMTVAGDLPDDDVPHKDDGSSLTTGELFAMMMHDAITKRQYAEADAARLASQRANADKEIELARQRREELDREIEAANRAAEAAAQAERLVKRKQQPPAITIQVARSIADRLLVAFDSLSASNRSTDTLAAFWNEYDNLLWEATTTEVAPLARRLMLAVDIIFEAVHEWELDRQKIARLNGESTEDANLDASPLECSTISRLVEELRGFINGTLQPRKWERVGELFSQGLSPQQIAKALGMVRIDGTGDTGKLGAMIDWALSQAGYYASIHGIASLGRWGAPAIETCWQFRDAGIERRREAVLDRREKTWRTGATNMPQTEDTSAFPQVFKNAVVSHHEAAKRKIEETRKRRLEAVNYEADEQIGFIQ